MRSFFLPILTFLATVCDFTSAVNDCLDVDSSDYKCHTGGVILRLGNCGITDDDLADLETCIDTVGRGNIVQLQLNDNALTMLTAGIFDSLTSVSYLLLDDNALTTLPDGIFDSLGSMTRLWLNNNQLTTLPAGIFDSLTSLTFLYLNGNALTTLDVGIFDSLTSLLLLYLNGNALTTLDVGIFDSLTSVGDLYLNGNALTTLPAGIFDSLAGSRLSRLYLHDNELTTLPAGIFDPLSSRLSTLHLNINELTTLPDGIFESLTRLSTLDLTGNALECMPSVSMAACESFFPGETCTPNEPSVDGGVDECDAALTPEAACGDGVDLCDDPHMKGLSGQKIDWSGVNGGWYCLVKDDEADLHVNVRLTAPLPEEFPERQLVTGLSVISTGHSLVVEVTNPYETHMNDGCPDGVSTPCLANGGLSVTVNGEKDTDDNPLLHPVRAEILPGGSMEVSAANLPVECWGFGGDAIWARRYADMMAQGRRTESGQSFEDWVLSFDHMAAHDWCTENITKNGLSGVQSSHAIFQIVTPAIVVRLNVGVGHQIGGELDWDGRVLPDLDVWQMDVGLVGLSVENESLTGILGETARPVYDKDGHAVMSGDDAFRGAVEDYRVSNGLGTDFALLHPN